MAHTVIKTDLIENRNGEIIYIGPLEDAKRFVQHHENVTVVVDENETTVLIGTTHAPAEEVTWETADNWGTHEDEDMAWRYALGSMFGSAASEFQELDLSIRAYTSTYWQHEADYPAGREGVYFIEILDPDGEEYAVIIHRTENGQFPIGGNVSNEKLDRANKICEALNATL